MRKSVKINQSATVKGSETRRDRVINIAFIRKTWASAILEVVSFLRSKMWLCIWLAFLLCAFLAIKVIGWWQIGRHVSLLSETCRINVAISPTEEFKDSFTIANTAPCELEIIGATPSCSCLSVDIKNAKIDHDNEGVVNYAIAPLATQGQGTLKILLEMKLNGYVKTMKLTKAVEITLTSLASMLPINPRIEFGRFERYENVKKSVAIRPTKKNGWSSLTAKSVPGFIVTTKQDEDSWVVDVEISALEVAGSFNLEIDCEAKDPHGEVKAFQLPISGTYTGGMNWRPKLLIFERNETAYLRIEGANTKLSLMPESSVEIISRRQLEDSAVLGLRSKVSSVRSGVVRFAVENKYLEIPFINR